MITLAGAFLTFLGFLFAGLLALVVTAVLDRHIGKERALLLWSGLLLLFTFWQCTPDVATVRAKTKADSTVPKTRVEAKGDPFLRPELDDDLVRNPFQKHSDTQPLPPITLEDPPWLALEMELPPTIPGPAPAARYLLRGVLPALESADAADGDEGSDEVAGVEDAEAANAPPVIEVPDPQFQDYVPVVDDVYDALVDGGRATYVYIRRIREDGKWTEEGEGRFEVLKWALVRRSTGWEDLQVEAALIGNADSAARYLEPSKVLARKRMNVSTVRAGQFDEWRLRETVDNLYTRILRKRGLKRDLETTQDISALQEAARQMAEVGRTGKERQEGWRRAADLLERARTIARERGVPALLAEVLQDLVTAYAALKDEQAVMRILAEYARVSPNRPEPWLWLGQLHLRRLALADEALRYFRTALDRSSRSLDARLGEGDALSALGRHEEALAAYKRAGTGYAAKVGQAEASLRLGDLSAAAAAAQVALAVQEGARALLVHGAVLYAANDVEKARGAFAQAASFTGDSEEVALRAEANAYRAQACYDLGLACWRLGLAPAALAAFDACEHALRYGADPARFPDEMVSPAFGYGLISLAEGNVGAFLSRMQEAGEEAPGVTYHATLTGMMAARDGNDAVAIRAFQSALRMQGGYPPLDAWIARTRLDLARQAIAAGTPAAETAADFDAAVAFAARATRTEKARDRRAFRAALRECWIRIHAENLPARQRFDRARAVADAILKLTDAEQPGALTLRGYCYYQLAGLGASDPTLNDPYDACIRDFQAVKDKVPAEDQGEWASWRAYATRSLDAVKHWRNLEEKTVVFEGTSLPPGWAAKEPAGVRARVEDGQLVLSGNAHRDGGDMDPIISLFSEELFKVGTFEEVRMLVRIPTKDKSGAASNIVTFGVEVQRRGGSGRRAGGRPGGVGLYYDRGKIAARIGGGREEFFKSGEMRRVMPETPWPVEDGWVEIRIAREEGDDGRLALYLDLLPDDGITPEPVVQDILGAFKGSGRSAARLLLVGWSTQAQEFDIQIKGLRVIRRKR